MPSSINVLVRRRNGDITEFNINKIETALMNAFIGTEPDLKSSQSVHSRVDAVVSKAVSILQEASLLDSLMDVEFIQDCVERALMASDEHAVLRAYILYREAHQKTRKDETVADADKWTVQVKHGSKTQSLNVVKIKKVIRESCSGLAVDSELVFNNFKSSVYNGITNEEVFSALVLAVRPLIETHPDYAYVAARLHFYSLRKEVIGRSVTADEMLAVYPTHFKNMISVGIKNQRIDPEMATFDLDRLGVALCGERDNLFMYQGAQILTDRYFLHVDGRHIELPQTFFMRVAMGLALKEDDREARAIEFYNVLSTFDLVTSTPTLFNAGTLRPQLSSCFLSTVSDDLVGIYDAIKENALLSKYSGGLGNDWTPVRGLGAQIKGTNGKSQGIIPFLKVVNDTAVAVNQGGKRKGAVCAYLETWHIDIEEFLELRKNTGDDRRRAHDMNTANWIPDLFMERVAARGDWTLFSPDEVPDLHDLYGVEFKKRYEHYEKMAEKGSLKVAKKLPAVELWRKMLTMLFETGHPWITFKDACNIRSPQQHVGVVHSSNLCTEITLNSTPDTETAVCNLASINLVQHMRKGTALDPSDLKGIFDVEKIQQTMKTGMRMLDNVVDLNYYAIDKARNSNQLHRPVGLGVMGFVDAMTQYRISYNSDMAVEFADVSQEIISYYAIDASADLARERGSYSSFDGSLWSKGILPIDSLEMLEKVRHIDVDRKSVLDWAPLRAKVRNGMRNSNCLAIAPTATIANIIGVSQGIEPIYQNLYVKSNLSGEFTVLNPSMVRDLIALDIWDAAMIMDLKYYDGSLSDIERIPQELKDLYVTAFEMDSMYLIESAARRQKWIDQSQSVNLYFRNPNGKLLDMVYTQAWKKGLKTTYYLRSLGATSAEKSTGKAGALNAVKVSVTPADSTVKACLIDDPTCEACQ